MCRAGRGAPPSCDCMQPQLCFPAASACLCGCFFALASPGDECAYVGGYLPTAILHLSVGLLRITAVCGWTLTNIHLLSGQHFLLHLTLEVEFLWRTHFSPLKQSELVPRATGVGVQPSQRNVWETNLWVLKPLPGQLDLTGKKFFPFLSGMFDVELCELSFNSVCLKLELRTECSLHNNAGRGRDTFSDHAGRSEVTWFEGN